MQERWKEFNKEYTTDRLAEEMKKLKKMHCYQEKEKAQTSDQFKTPHWIK